MRLLIATLFIVSMVGCTSDPPQPPVVVYASDGEGSELDDLFAAFFSETNIPVSPIWGDSTTNTDQLIGNANDLADVLITNNVADIWRAAEEGVLRPINSPAFVDVDPLLKDEDGFWAAINTRQHAIAMPTGEIRPIVASYDQLASPELRGRICLSSSKLHVNRSLIAMLINDRGIKTAERLVRKWIRNLAASPFSSQEELIAALRSGVCDYGIVAWMPDVEGIAYFLPDEGYMDVDAIGITRHAHQPESAQRLVEWLLDKKTVRVVDGSGRRPVGIAGWRDEDARLLAERAAYR